MKLLPTLFLSHGSPMHALSPGVVGDAWSALGKRIDRPDAILMCSAHWETALPMVSGNRKPETIHDFGGFPQALYEIRYPAPGAPALAARVIELLKDARITAGIDGCRGLDHGAWVPLRWMYPTPIYRSSSSRCNRDAGPGTTSSLAGRSQRCAMKTC